MLFIYIIYIILLGLLETSNISSLSKELPFLIQDNKFSIMRRKLNESNVSLYKEHQMGCCDWSKGTLLPAFDWSISQKDNSLNSGMA